MFKKLNNQETYRSLFPMVQSPLLEQLKHITTATTAKVEPIRCECDTKCDCVDIKQTLADFTITAEPKEVAPKDPEDCYCEECHY
jgi:hypothetical protein